MNKTHETCIKTIVAAVVALGVGMGAMQAVAEDGAVPQARSDGLVATVDDTVITAKVKGKLMGEPGLKKSEISVTTTNGVVTLDGAASSSEAKALAESLSNSVEGVRSVDNNLKTPHDNAAVTKTKRVISDSWITTKVKSGLLADSVSKGIDVSVTTTHGVVVLKGVLPNQDTIVHVKDIAAKVDGVKSVDISSLTVTEK